MLGINSLCPFMFSHFQRKSAHREVQSKQSKGICGRRLARSHKCRGVEGNLLDVLGRGRLLEKGIRNVRRGLEKDFQSHSRHIIVVCFASSGKINTELGTNKAMDGDFWEVFRRVLQVSRGSRRLLV